MITINGKEIPEIEVSKFREFIEINSDFFGKEYPSFINSFFKLSRLEQDIQYFHPGWKPLTIEEKIQKAIQKHSLYGKKSNIERSGLPAHGNTFLLTDAWKHIACFGYWGNSSLYYASKHCLELFFHDGNYFLVDQYVSGSGNQYSAETYILCRIEVV